MLQADKPGIAFRDCRDCREHLYHEEGEKSGQRILNKMGQPMRRKPSQKPMCERPSGCPKGHWSKPKEITANQQRLVDFYASVRATNGIALGPNPPRALLFAIGQLDQIVRSIEAGRQHATLVAIASLSKMNREAPPRDA